MSIAAIKSLCHRSSFCCNCLFPVLGGVFSSADSFRSTRWKRFKLKHKMYLAITYHPSMFQLPVIIGGRETTHGSRVPRGLGFQN